MTVLNIKNITAATVVSAIALASSSAAYAQAFNGTTGDAPTTTVTLGDSTTETTGDTDMPPFINVTTTVQEQTVDSTTAPTTTNVSTTINGETYTGTKTVSGTGSQAQTVTSTLTNTFDGGTPPTLLTSVPEVNPAEDVGDPTVTAVSASGAVGSGIGPANYGSNLSTSGPVTNGSVVATETSSLLSTSGATYSSRTGTATYDPSTGDVTVSLPSTPTSQTTVSATGVTTTGSINATSGNFNGGRITGVGAGIDATDAVNVGQLDAAVATLNSSIAATNGNVATLSSLVEDNRRRADAGIATAVALSGATFLPNKKINVTANLGGYRSELAIAGQVGVLVSDNIAFNAGVATSLEGYGGTSYRGGFTFGF